QRTYLIYYLGIFAGYLRDVILNNRFLSPPPSEKVAKKPHRYRHRITLAIWYIVIIAVITLAFFMLLRFIFDTLTLAEAWHTVRLGSATFLRVLAAIVISCIIWLPLGVWIGLRPTLAKFIQPIIQFLAAFPANLLFPLLVWLIMRYALNIQVWLTTLMIIGSMWYIAFNVIAGTRNLPRDYHYATENLGVRGWLWWKRFILPGIFPYLITGAITTAGAAWNLSIVAEFVTWGDKTLVAYGLGAYITESTHAGDFHRTALGIAVMCIFVLVINRLVWQPLYKLAEERFGV
ncbi:MAG: ABC transporter permease subunit, partial [Gammaproteobacteria bacterium]|nr:ABC transporter permease subunit [Gammaproteobacteria bacterium]